jgi:hypothetical protein
LRDPLPIIHPRDAVALAFENVYELGDRWEKRVGCEGCVTNCCNNCPAKLADNSCQIHRMNPENKELRCIVWPRPSLAFPGCQQVFECVRGSSEILGKFRHVGDSEVRFRNGR